MPHLSNINWQSGIIFLIFVFIFFKNKKKIFWYF